MNLLYRQIHFLVSFRRKVLVGFILGMYLSFIVIVLQPFDTSQFESENKLLLLSGYGIFVFALFVIFSCIENLWYFRTGKVWRLWYEILSILGFCLFAGTVLYIYNRIVVNSEELEMSSYSRFLLITIGCMIPVFVPPILYLRQKFGERIIPPPQNSIRLIGENKNEILQIEKEELLYIRAVENYVEICFVDDSKKAISKTFRQTLSKIGEQLPFLEKCHRSYLVNTPNIKDIIGNSQSAKISFVVGEKEIPISKTYYKHLKSLTV